MFPKLTQVSEGRYSPEINVEGKGYVTVDIARNPQATNLYWQLVDPAFSLLELGFEWPSGRLVNCAVPLFKGEVEDDQSQTVRQGIAGTPFFDLAPWPLQVSDREVRGNHLRHPGRIRLLKGQNALSIICQNGSPFHSITYGGKLVCDFGMNNEIVALNLLGNFSL